MWDLSWCCVHCHLGKNEPFLHFYMFSVFVLSAQLGNFKHIDSQSPDTAHMCWKFNSPRLFKGMC